MTFTYVSISRQLYLLTEGSLDGTQFFQFERVKKLETRTSNLKLPERLLSKPRESNGVRTYISGGLRIFPEIWDPF